MLRKTATTGGLFVLKSIIATFDAGIMDENVLNKLKILAESAKYDVSCSSSGTVRSGKAGMLGTLWVAGASAIVLPRTAVVSPCSK